MLTGRRRPWRPQITRAECYRGWVFFALYVFLFPWLMGWVQRSYQGEFPVAEANVVYYLIIAALTFLVFWSFLRTGCRRTCSPLSPAWWGPRRSPSWWTSSPCRCRTPT